LVHALPPQTLLLQKKLKKMLMELARRIAALMNIGKCSLYLFSFYQNFIFCVFITASWDSVDGWGFLRLILIVNKFQKKKCSYNCIRQIYWFAHFFFFSFISHLPFFWGVSSVFLKVDVRNLWSGTVGMVHKAEIKVLYWDTINIGWENVIEKVKEK
jgi:hypothetical protein